jgi:hypothetical protein
MDEAVQQEDAFAAGEWESWLAEAFVAYLLRDADGQRRPPAEVERALARLSGQPDALVRLASLAFVLDPEARVEAWIRDEVPAFLRRIRVRSQALTTVRRNVVRGRIDWGRTIALRQATQDPTWIASRSLVRTFDTPELVTVRFVVDRIRAIAGAVLRAELAARSGWTASVAAIAALATAIESHSALQEVPVRRPDSAECAVARASHDPVVRAAARILDTHDELLPTPVSERLRDALSRFALVPLNEDVRFQVFAMLALIDCIDRLAGSAQRHDSILARDRDEVVRWDGSTFTLKLHYDQAAGSGIHADVMLHYFGRGQSLRPDLRLELTRDGITRELIVDAKRSTRASYLADAHHKMRGYIADRPGAFMNGKPKAIVVCPAVDVGSPRPADDVVFVGVDAGRAGHGLANALSRWWE